MKAKETLENIAVDFDTSGMVPTTLGDKNPDLHFVDRYKEEVKVIMLNYELAPNVKPEDLVKFGYEINGPYKSGNCSASKLIKEEEDEIYIVFQNNCFPTWNRAVMWNSSHTPLKKLDKHIQDLVNAGMVN